MCINLKKKKLLQINKTEKAILFDNIFDLVLCLFPETLDTSTRRHVRYSEMKGSVGDIFDITENAIKQTWTLRYSSLLQQMCTVVLKISRKIGIMYDHVELSKINREYVKYHFEEVTIKEYQNALKADATKEEIDDFQVVFDADEVRKYCILNKVKWYLDMIENETSQF
jgi:hypothetical protein